MDPRYIQKDIINPNMDGKLKVIKISTPFSYELKNIKGSIDWSEIVLDQRRNTFIRNLVYPYKNVQILSDHTFSTISYIRANGNDALKGNLKVMITPFTTDRLTLTMQDIILDLVDDDKWAIKDWERRSRIYRRHNIPVVE